MPLKITPTSEVAVQQYIEMLDSEERSNFSGTTVEDVLASVQALERRQAIFSRVRRISRRVEPVVQFLQRYAKGVDVLVQGRVPLSALAWGCLRFVLEVQFSRASSPLPR